MRRLSPRHRERWGSPATGIRPGSTPSTPTASPTANPRARSAVPNGSACPRIAGPVPNRPMERVARASGSAARATHRRVGCVWWDSGVAGTPLVIDTDPGFDDALALLLALASPEVDLRLVTTVRGNVDLARTTENALRVLHLAGRSDVPVAVGARTPLVVPQPERAGHVHGAAGLGGVVLPPSPAPVDPRPAVVALAELLLASEAPVTVAAVGPLTNIALLLAVYPDAAARIGRLVVMGGSAHT